MIEVYSNVLKTVTSPILNIYTIDCFEVHHRCNGSSNDGFFVKIKRDKESFVISKRIWNSYKINTSSDYLNLKVKKYISVSENRLNILIANKQTVKSIDMINNIEHKINLAKSLLNIITK